MRAGAATLVPRDQEAALATLARPCATVGAQVVAVVGSTGKTTTKDALASLCGGVTPTVAAEASRNNELGLPLTVFRLEPTPRCSSPRWECAASGRSRRSARRPAHALPRHVHRPGAPRARRHRGRRRARQRRGDRALPAGGVAVVPGDEPLLEPYLAGPTSMYGASSASGSSATATHGCFRSVGAKVRLELPFSQRHLAENVLAALTAYDALGLPLDRAREGAAAISLAGGAARCRSFRAAASSSTTPTTRTRSRCGQPCSISSSVQAHGAGWRSSARWRSSATRATRYHAEIGELLEKLGIEVVVAVGERRARYLAAQRVRRRRPGCGAFDASRRCCVPVTRSS